MDNWLQHISNPLHPKDRMMHFSTASGRGQLCFARFIWTAMFILQSLSPIDVDKPLSSILVKAALTSHHWLWINVAPTKNYTRHYDMKFASSAMHNQRMSLVGNVWSSDRQCCTTVVVGQSWDKQSPVKWDTELLAAPFMSFIFL